MLNEFLHRLICIQTKGKTVILKTIYIYRFLYNRGFLIDYNVYHKNTYIFTKMFYRLDVYNFPYN